MRDFFVLSDIEFEELVGDLLAAELKLPVERFGVGRDGGIDLRWDSPTSTKKSIGQCKHYQRSTFSQLLAAAKAEVSHLEEVNPDGYRFITSFDLTVGQKTKLYEIFGRWMESPSDVVGARDVDGLLTTHENVERRHPKLWLSTGSQLFWTTHSDLANRASALRERIEASLTLYVLNRGYREALDILDAHRVCLIAGVPGIGKTMLAQILLADAMAQGYEPVEVSGDISEGWTALRADEPQVFLYDDFLGQLSFAERLGKNEDARLSSFISKISSTRSKLLIMTTREYILHDAQRAYQRLLELDERMHFVLALSNYTRGDRARILYNHLWHADVSTGALIEVAGGGYRPIVDHPNYSPRLIEYCTGRLFDTQGPGYVDRFVNTLNHPARLWRVAFESHLTDEQRLLVVVLATMPPRVEVRIVQTAHVALCRQMAVVTTAASFRAALEVLEGTFISIGQIEGEPTVSFHNPSIREFTLDWLADDSELLKNILTSATYFEQMRQLYTYAAGSRRSGGHEGLHAALGTRVDDFKNALVHTIRSPCPEKREEWDHEEGSIYREKSSWLEERLDFLLGLDQLWAPDSEWIEGVLSTLERRWRAKQGWKNEAVKVMQAIALAGVGKAPIAIHPSVAEKLGQALDGWLVQDLEDTEEDWVPYLERLKQDHRVVLAHRTDVAARFEEHARDELSRWSPSPPSMDELQDYASQFGLDDLIQTLDEKVEEDRQRDHETSQKIHDRPPPLSSSEASGGDDYDSDDAIGKLFGRFAQETADASQEGSAPEE